MPRFVLHMIVCSVILAILQFFFDSRRRRLMRKLGLRREQVSNIPLQTPGLRKLELRYIKVNLALIVTMAAYIYYVWVTSTPLK